MIPSTIKLIASLTPGVFSLKISTLIILSKAERATPVAAAGMSSLCMTSRMGEM